MFIAKIRKSSLCIFLTLALIIFPAFGSQTIVLAGPGSWLKKFISTRINKRTPLPPRRASRLIQRPNVNDVLNSVNRRNIPPDVSKQSIVDLFGGVHLEIYIRLGPLDPSETRLIIGWAESKFGPAALKHPEVKQGLEALKNALSSNSPGLIFKREK